MVMVEGEDKSWQAQDALLDEEDQMHDGWGPVQLRRSSMPAPMAAESARDDDQVGGESLTKPLTKPLTRPL